MDRAAALKSHPNLTYAMIVRARDLMLAAEPKDGEIFQNGGTTFQRRGDVYVEIVGA